MSTKELRDFLPFPKACIERGIGKTRAYELLNQGKLDTRKVGRKRFIYEDSLKTLLAREGVDDRPVVKRNSEGARA